MNDVSKRLRAEAAIYAEFAAKLPIISAAGSLATLLTEAADEIDDAESHLDELERRVAALERQSVTLSNAVALARRK